MRRKQEKTILTILLIMIISIGTFDNMSVYAKAIGNANNTSSMVVKSKQTVWRFRTYNGKRQKRLWSKTDHKWLTDWMSV